MSPYLKQIDSTRAADGENDISIYDARYFDDELHRSHWFTNNTRKRDLRWRAVMQMLQPAITDRVLEVGCAAVSYTHLTLPTILRV